MAKKRKYPPGTVFIVGGVKGRNHLSHSGDGKVYYPGDEVTMDHLTDEQIDWFVARRVFWPKEAETEAAE